ncbi:MAG: SMP-30/gluconolactonase/LRE family protein [Hydrogenophaga sp.]|uniref:SMP-30/gluconolactonase/LRE family protein n=1 Tax=Hydrogenophaga sp. TaxID=1904254 RepID=UPI001D4F7DF8|nr:SMP-30/gluconolactonase/LRE family protein [Hydrogenophaga sp.]MBX3610592.1 SMP-30/gluconolactonase/LRE family protein [Hydrogenophaga sp.]
MSKAPASALTPLIDGLCFAEAPRWRDGRLWFSDFFHAKVFSASEQGDLRAECEVPAHPSGLGWRPDGHLLVVSMQDRRLLIQRDGQLQTLVDLTPLTGGHCNDMVVDAQGRAYVGNFGFDLYAGEPLRPTRLLRVDPDASVHVVADDMVFPNGMAITPDGGTLIVAETHVHRLSAFDIAPSGALLRRRIWADLPGVFVDGLCLDAEGAIWVADARGQQVLRVAPGGEIVRRVSSGAHNSYACMLGGHDGRTLFVCTAPGIGPVQGARREGRIQTLRVDVPHAGLP